MEEESPEPKPDAEKCGACGGWIGETGPGAGVCLSCGKAFGTPPSEAAADEPAATACPKCGADQDPDAAFCDQCGASMSAPPPPADGTCPACGGPVVEVSPDHGVCRKCGENLVTPATRNRNRVGLVLALIAAAAFILWTVSRGL